MRKLRGKFKWSAIGWGRARVLAVLVTMLAGMLSVVVGADAASGSIRVGLGHRVDGGDFVGFYVAGGKKVYCLSPMKVVPRTVSLSNVSRYPGLSPTASRQLAFALFHWGDARSVNEAVVESQVLNTLAGNGKDVRRRAHSLPAALSRAVAAHVVQARSQAGPYTVRVSTPRALLPGQSATGSVQVRSSNGHGVAGIVVRLVHSPNATVPTQVRTDYRGLARMPYAVSDVDQVRIVATAHGLAPVTVQTSHPRSSEQRMVSWTAQIATRGSASFRGSVSGFSNSYACTTTCDGRPLTTLSACAPASRYASRLVYAVDGSRVIADFPASTKRVCRAVLAHPADGMRVTAAWQYRAPHGWSRPVPAAGTFTLDCPAAPEVTVAMSYDCTRGLVSIALGHTNPDGSRVPLVNTSRHRFVLVVGGAKTTRVYADHGRGAVFTSAVACGLAATYTMQAGVQRANGGWNYGRTASVVTP
ncbi:MAG: hypothetical protein M3Y06_06120 [Actinomycetota bacterium]|nr:hypothetical protein [Actinomycetota bacterium]